MPLIGLLGLPLMGLLGGVKPDIGRLGVTFWYDGGVPGVGGRCCVMEAGRLNGFGIVSARRNRSGVD